LKNTKRVNIEEVSNRRWREKEKDIYPRVKEIVDDILRNNKEIRITRTYLAKELKCSYITHSNRLAKMIKLKQYIMNHTESLQDYRARIAEK